MGDVEEIDCMFRQIGGHEVQFALGKFIYLDGTWYLLPALNYFSRV